MKATKSTDGVLRSTVRISYRIELGGLLLAALELYEDDERLTRAAIEQQVRRRLSDRGYDWLHYGHEQTGAGQAGEYDEVAAPLLPRVALLFPGFDR